MFRRSILRPLIAAGWLCALSCSLVVDTSDVDEGCGSNRKLCADKCVEQRDPAYGCASTGCDPCRLTNAIPRCDGEVCVVDACLLGFDCPERTMGCLTNVLVDSSNCGACQMGCDPGQSCSDGECVSEQAGAGN